MSVFTIDLLTGQEYLFTMDISGNTSPVSGGTYPEVTNYNDLPSPTTLNGVVYLVKNIYDIYDAGLYISNGTKWMRLGDILSYFSSNKFFVYNEDDLNTGFSFITSGISSNFIRQITVQDKDGILALMSDVDLKLNISEFDLYTGETSTLINNKREKIVNLIDVHSGGTFTSIKEACDYTSIVADIDNPYIIRAYGNYSEDPFTIPAHVELQLMGGVLYPNNNTSNFINIESYGEYRGGTIVMPTGNTYSAFYSEGLYPAVKDVIISGMLNYTGGTGIIANGSTRFLIRNVSIYNCYNGIVNDNSILILTTSSISNALNYGLILQNVSYSIINAVVAVACQMDIRSIGLNTVNMNACQFDVDKISIDDYSKIKMAFQSSKNGDEAIENIQEFHVGMPEKGFELCSGEGDSYNRGILVYTFDGSEFVDVSTIAASYENSTFTFPNTLSGSSIYVSSKLIKDGGSKMKFYGLKLVTPEIIDLGTGSILLKYWNGSAWSELNYMISDGSSPYYPLAKTMLQQSGGTQCRFNIRMYDWVVNDPIGIGVDYYWIKIEIDDDITTSPSIEQIKLHSSRIEINEDGYLEYYGNARPRGSLYWDLGLTQPATNSPADQDIFLSDTLNVGRIENRFNNNTTSRIGYNAYLPTDMDTSSPIALKWSFISNGTSSGYVRWTVRWGWSKDGDPVYLSATQAPTTGVNEKSLSVDVPVGTTSNIQYSSELFLDVSELVSVREIGNGDVIWVTLERNGSQDTHTDYIVLLNFHASYWKWSEGIHI